VEENERESAPGSADRLERDSALGSVDRLKRDSALERAVRALARRDHSSASLGAKLERAGVSDEARADVLEALARAGYVDDVRFARDRAAHLAERGYGDKWIRADLEAQGVDAEAREQAVRGLEPERDRAVREAASLGGGIRAARTLARRGFSEDCVEAAVPGTVADDRPEGVG
jgi:regulatory protein